MIAPYSAQLIARRLQKARETRRLTIDQAATALRIRLRYIEAMERGDFDTFPSPAQARGFLRSYAQSLGLDADAFMAALDGDTSLLEAGSDEALEEQATLEDQAALEGEAEFTSEYGDDSAGGDGTAPAGVAPGGTPVARPTPARPTPVRAPRTRFGEIGQKLRTQRETLGLSLDDVERHTRLRAFYLKALEAGDLDGLPSPVQGRGMLKNYATFLGMDVDALLMQFAEGLQARLAERQGTGLMRTVKNTVAGRSTEVTPMGSPQPRLITTDLVLAGVLVVFLLAFIVWGGIRISTMGGHTPTETAPAISDVLAEVGTPTNPYAADATRQPVSTQEATQAEAPTTPEGSATLPPDVPTAPANFSSAAVQIIISVRMRAWMRVTVDDKVVFEGRVLPGSAFPFAGDQRVEILTGNGAGLDVNYNQSDIGILGTFGQAVQRVFTVQGMQTPTPSITPTPLPPTPTETPTPTP